MGLLLAAFGYIIYRERKFREKWIASLSVPAPKIAKAAAHPVPVAPVLIPLLEAATNAFEVTRDGIFANKVRREQKTAEAIILEYADHFRRCGLLYGSVPPSKRLEKIPSRVSGELRLVRQGDRFIAQEKRSDFFYDDISVDKKDFPVLFRFIGS
jgi:hypothetical protein